MNYPKVILLLITLSVSKVGLSQDLNLVYELETGVGKLLNHQFASPDSNGNTQTRNHYKNDGYKTYIKPTLRLGVKLEGLAYKNMPISANIGLGRGNFSFGITYEFVDYQFIHNYLFTDLGIGAIINMTNSTELQLGVACQYIFNWDGMQKNFQEDFVFEMENDFYEFFDAYRFFYGNIEIGLFHKPLFKFLKPGIKLRSAFTNLNKGNPSETKERGYLSNVNFVIQLGQF